LLTREVSLTRGQRDNRVRFLYRIVDDVDALLYVGQTVDPRTRLRGHFAEQHWWFRWADRMIVGECLGCGARQGGALPDEAAFIAAERPVFNVGGSECRLGSAIRYIIGRGEDVVEYVPFLARPSVALDMSGRARLGYAELAEMSHVAVSAALRELAGVAMSPTEIEQRCEAHRADRRSARCHVRLVDVDHEERLAALERGRVP
jgi:hypothetical protein